MDFFIVPLGHWKLETRNWELGTGNSLDEQSKRLVEPTLADELVGARQVRGGGAGRRRLRSCGQPS
jgi:hypothetical protein